jgi:hypothetical protein
MKSTRHAPGEMNRKPKATDELIEHSKAVADDCRDPEYCTHIYHRWCQLDGGIKGEVAKSLKEQE